MNDHVSRKSLEIRGRLTVLDKFGTDPGSLSAGIYIPKSFPKNGPLVVVLHGSTQSAESYDIGSGWSNLAEESGLRFCFRGKGKLTTPSAASTGSNWATATAAVANRSLFAR